MHATSIQNGSVRRSSWKSLSSGMLLILTPPCHLAATGHDLAETTAYHAGAKIFRVPACRCEIVDPRSTDVVYHRGAEIRAEARSIFGIRPSFTHIRVLGRPPAEADLQRHFGVSPPSVHQMVLTLERAELIRRQPGVSRSIEVLVLPEQLPVLR